jgi:hypothetical protein
MSHMPERTVSRPRRAAFTVALVAVLVVVLAVSAVASGAAPASKPGRASTPKRIAQSAAGQLLGAFRPPPGAQRSAKDPGPRTLFGGPAQSAATPNLVDRHGFWRVPGPTDEALNWVQSHLPAGAHQVVSGSAIDPGGASIFYVGYALPAGNRAIASRQLLVAVTSLHSDTAMRVDAQVIWLTRRPGSERIPAGVRAVRVVAQRLGQASSAARTVTGAAQVARIVSLVDALPAAQPGAYACPNDTGQLVVLRFLSGGPTPRTLATAKADGSGCAGVSLTIRGRAQPGLSGGAKLIQRLNALLGLSLS